MFGSGKLAVFGFSVLGIKGEVDVGQAVGAGEAAIQAVEAAVFRVEHNHIFDFALQKRRELLELRGERLGLHGGQGGEKHRRDGGGR